MERKPLLIIVCGPTATGKSDMAVQLALQHDGEVISADSRQVYKSLDIGSGKITSEEMQGVRHHLLDVASPSDIFTVSQYQALAKNAIADILHRGKVPILCGGTGLYIDAVVYDTTFPDVPRNDTLRETLTPLCAEDLAAMLAELDPARHDAIDRNNRPRLIRAIEIARAIGTTPPMPQTADRTSPYQLQWHYLDFPDEVLRDRIHRRLVARIDTGMIEEVQRLHAPADDAAGPGLSWERLDELGLEYRYVARYLQGLLTKDEMLAALETAIWQYAKRQRTWCKKYQ